MAKPGNLEFNFIYIVQSLGPDELPTGSYLDLFAMQPRVEGMKGSGLQFGAEVVDVAVVITSANAWNVTGSNRKPATLVAASVVPRP